MAASEFGGQIVSKDRHFLTFRRANMRGKDVLSAAFTPLWSKKDQLGKLAGRQPRKPTVIADPPERQPPVAFEPMPAQVGGRKPFAAHGLHGIPEDRLNMSDFY